MYKSRLLPIGSLKATASRAASFVTFIVSRSRGFFRLPLASFLMIAFALATSSVAFASGNTHWVNDNDPNGGLYVPPGTSCDNPGYATIQSAVNAAAPGDRINVCPGTYTEQVTVPAVKNNITLRSVQLWQAVIKAPALMLDAKAIVRVTGAQNVTILAFTITGPGGFVCDSLRYGVRVDGGGSANILGNHITQIRDNPFSGCQNGVAVLVGRASEATTGSAKIIGNLIDNYQKNGPTIENAGSHADVYYNRILGIGPSAVIAQNGLQVAAGATANVGHNFISGHLYTPQTFASTGMLLFQSGKVAIDHNTLSANDVGIDMFNPAAGSVTSSNVIRASTFDGIALFPANGQQVSRNETEDNTGPGIGVYDSQNNSLYGNEVEGNDDSGILLDNGDNNSVSSNSLKNNGTGNADTTDGLRVNALSDGNTIKNNRLRQNVTHDCHDDSTGNFWINNRGNTWNRPGLCRADDDDDGHGEDDHSGHGWNANYAWSVDFGIPEADYDWAAAYATLDTASLLQLMPAISVSGVRGVSLSPAP
jgi:parallel beta-helix repeat protein